MICYLVHDYLPALGETLAVELGVAFLLGFREMRQLLAVALVNFVTHPSIHFIMLLVVFFKWMPINLPFILILELMVFLVEWALLAYALRLKPARACLLSLSMNLASYLFGPALQVVAGGEL